MKHNRSTWKKYYISDACDAIIDCVNKTAITVDYPTPFKMIRTTNVRNGWIDTENVKYVIEDVYKIWTRRGEPKFGDVILTREAPLGEAGLLRNRERIFLGQRLVMYRTNPQVFDNKFLLYSMLGHDLQSQIKALGSGSTVEHMRVPDCEKLIINLPPLSVQKKIAGILSAYDDLIENNTRRIQILEEMAQRIYCEWFVYFRYPGHENDQLVESEIGMIPEGWGVKRIMDIQFFRFIRENLSFFEGEKTYFATADINGTEIVKPGIIYSFNNKPSRAQKQPLIYSVWFARMKDTFKILGFTEINKTFAKNTMLSSGFAGFQSDKDYFGFLYNTIISEDFHKLKDIYCTGATQISLTNDGLSKITIIVPPEELILKYCEIVNSIIDQCLILRKQNSILLQTRDLLLPKLISGKIDVSELDINMGEMDESL